MKKHAKREGWGWNRKEDDRNERRSSLLLSLSLSLLFLAIVFFSLLPFILLFPPFPPSESPIFTCSSSTFLRSVLVRALLPRRNFPRRDIHCRSRSVSVCLVLLLFHGRPARREIEPSILASKFHLEYVATEGEGSAHVPSIFAFFPSLFILVDSFQGRMIWSFDFSSFLSFRLWKILK